MNPVIEESAQLLHQWQMERIVRPLRSRESIESLLPGCIDHTLLRPEATEDDIKRLCIEARECHFASVCVNPVWVQTCADLLTDSGVPVSTVIGFPLGALKSSTKIHQTTRAALSGAIEFDTVMLIGHLKQGRVEDAGDDMRAVVETAKASNPRHVVKIILETCLLDDCEKILAVLLARNAGADFVKTSTGFSSGGATVEDVDLLCFAAQGALRIKASGGIRTRETALQMLEHGADRIGSSASLALI